MKNSLAKTRILGVLFLLILAIPLWVFLISPSLSAPAEAEAEVDQLQQQVAQTNAQITAAQQTVSTLPQIRKQVKKLSRQYPDKANPLSLTRAVYRAAAVAGIPRNNVTGLTVGEPAPFDPNNPTPTAGGTDPSAAPTPDPAAGGTGTGSTGATGDASILQQTVSATVVGTPTQIGRFATALKNGKRVIVIDTLNIGAGTAATTPGTTAPAPTDPNATGTGPQPGQGEVSASVTASGFLLPPLQKEPNTKIARPAN